MIAREILVLHYNCITTFMKPCTTNILFFCWKHLNWRTYVRMRAWTISKFRICDTLLSKLMPASGICLKHFLATLDFIHWSMFEVKIMHSLFYYTNNYFTTMSCSTQLGEGSKEFRNHLVTLLKQSRVWAPLYINYSLPY